MQDYINFLIFDTNMFTENVEENINDLFENLTPLGDSDNSDILISDLLVNDLIDLNSIIEEKTELKKLIMVKKNLKLIILFLMLVI